MAKVVSPEINPDDQEKLLEEALKQVKDNSFQMKRCLDDGKMMEGLKFASNMLGELRTSLLSPKSYYELYMSVSDNLRYLQLHLVDEFEKGKKMYDLYEMVQYAGNIVPRLYLLVTVGAVFIKTNVAPARSILKDLIEMCRGVQHPLRGLFLRNHLLQTVKSELPEMTETNETGNLDDSIEVVLHNFCEMNKLWVRMQHQGHTRDRAKREQERQELRVLVGTNLVRLSSLENVTVQLYAKTILPQVIEQIVGCKDHIAQEYLMECIVKVFPDEFHLQTLNAFLAGCAQLQPQVNIKNIIASLIDRLAAFALRDASAVPAEIQLFDIFSTQVAEIIKSRPETLPEDVTSLQGSLVNLALKCYPTRRDYVDLVFGNCYKILTGLGVANVEQPKAVCKQILSFLQVPLVHYRDIQTTLDIQNFATMVALLGAGAKKEFALIVCENIIDNNNPLTDHDKILALFGILSPLIRRDDVAEGKEDDPTSPKDDPTDDSFIEEQTTLARIIHNFGNPNPDLHYKIISTARKQFGAGGNIRMKFTLPPLIFQVLQLTRVYNAQEEKDEIWVKKVEKLFQFARQTILGLVKGEYYELALRLFLQAAIATSFLSFENSETIAYDFISQAFLLFEDEITDTKQQSAAIALIAATLVQLACFSDDNFNPLSTKCAQSHGKMVQKPDQCHVLCVASRTFWVGQTLESKGPRHDNKQTTSCLQKAGKTASGIIDVAAQTTLLIDILNNYIFYFEQGLEVPVAHMSKIAGLINQNIAKLEAGDETTQLSTYFRNTLRHIEYARAHGNTRYDEFTADA